MTEADLLLFFAAVKNTSEHSRDLAQTPVPFSFSLRKEPYRQYADGRNGVPSAGAETAQNM